MKGKTSKQIQEHLERSLATRIQALYLRELAHDPNKVSCNLSNKTLTIIIENTITQPERLLVESGKQEFAELMRFNINKAFESQLKAAIEETLGVSVVDLLGNSKMDTGITSIIAILAATPQPADSLGEAT